jgi:hypothetical protein
MVNRILPAASIAASNESESVTRYCPTYLGLVPTVNVIN